MTDESVRLLMYFFVSLVVAVALYASLADGATLCRESPGTGSYWSWREIAGKRCWYEGRVVKDKTDLFWNVSVVPARSLTEQELNYQLGVELLKWKFRDIDELSMLTQW